MRFGSMRLIGQMLASYLVLETPAGMLLVDQHAAHERILYERLRAGWLEHEVARQGLLVPVSVELEPLALDALLGAERVTEQLGFDLARFGENAVVVRAVPALLSGRDPAGLVRELAEELERGEAPTEATAASTRLIAAVDRIFATLACHAARRFGDHLEPGEQRAILEGLDEIPWAPTCPHGRPVAAPLSTAEIERRFARR
jgi:DNA mismatch repair protein MutL